jgi:hypothetical protein
MCFVRHVIHVVPGATIHLIHLWLIDVKLLPSQPTSQCRQERDASIGLDTGTIPSSMLRDNNNPRKFKLRWEAGPDEIINQVTESIRV